MGAEHSRPTVTGKTDLKVGTFRGQAITGGTAGKTTGTRSRPAHARPVEDDDAEFVVAALRKLLLFSRTDSGLVHKVVQGMWERDCDAGAPPRLDCC